MAGVWGKAIEAEETLQIAKIGTNQPKYFVRHTLCGAKTTTQLQYP